MNKAIKEKVLEKFEKYRQSPGANFDEEHFLDFLLSEPKGKRAVYNSFTGLKRLNNFINDVQTEFTVYFSTKDREAGYSLTRFVNRVEELQDSPQSSIASLRNSLKHGFEWNIAIIVNLVFALLFAFFFNNVIICLITIIAIVVVNYKLLTFYKAEKSYQTNLMSKLMTIAKRR